MMWKKSNTSSPKRRSVRQSFFCSLKRMPLLGSLPFRQFLQRKLLNGSPCFVPRCISKSSLSFVCQDYRLLVSVSFLRRSMYFRSISKCFNAFQLYSVERLREISGGDEHWEYTILCSVAPAFCTPSSDPQFDVSVCILLGQLADKGQTLGEAWCTTVWRTICTRQAEYKFGRTLPASCTSPFCESL